MNLENTINEIVSSIKQRDFLNEAEISNGVVLRILNELGWNVYDTKRVKPQYRIDNRMIDFALCFPDNKPIIIIEVKALGKAVNTDEQVLIYAFKTGIPVAILTDGQEWHFYLPAERGSLTERRFYKLDLLERTSGEIMEIFQSYLNFENVRNGTAIQKAKADYEKQYKSKEINEAIPKAWNKLLQERNTVLIELIAEKVADICGFEPAEETLIGFLNNLTKPKELISEMPLSTNYIEAPIRKILKKNFKGVKVGNVEYPAKTSIGTLEELLKIVINKFPNALSKIELQTKGRSRSLISKQKEKLYLNNPDLMQIFVKILPQNWYLGTNYSGREIERFSNIIKNNIDQEYGKQSITWQI